jgi:hypothetical protein
LRLGRKRGLSQLTRWLAREKVKEILATHKLEPIPENVQEEISQIFKRDEAELLKIS